MISLLKALIVIVFVSVALSLLILANKHKDKEASHMLAFLVFFSFVASIILLTSRCQNSNQIVEEEEKRTVGYFLKSDTEVIVGERSCYYYDLV